MLTLLIEPDVGGDNPITNISLLHSLSTHQRMGSLSSPLIWTYVFPMSVQCYMAAANFLPSVRD